MINYLHIGYPKNFSTSLQRNFFSRHPEIYHLGIGTSSNIGYKDDFLSSIFEVYLKSAKHFKYDEMFPRVREHILEHYSQAETLGVKAFGASSEHFSFSFTYDSLDFPTKIKRAIDLLGNNLQIIIIIREQIELIKSLYKESVRVGLPGSFQDFLYGLYKFQDRNYYYDLRYDLIFESLSGVLDKRNIHFFTFDSFRNRDKSLVYNSDGTVKITKDLCAVLNVSYMQTDFEHFNEALSDNVVDVKSRLNNETRHDLGNNLYSSAELHRQAAYFVNDLKLNEPESELFKDVLSKRKLMAEATRIAESQPVKSTALFDCDAELMKKVSEFYKRGNERFTKLSNINLPSYYY